MALSEPKFPVIRPNCGTSMTLFGVFECGEFYYKNAKVIMER